MSDYTHIYGIVDPQTRTVFYVGRSADPDHRLQDHIRFGRLGSTQPLATRMRSVLNAGLEPQLIILETVRKEVAARAEERWIAAFRVAGELCNKRDVCAIPRDAEGPRKPKPPTVKNSRGPRARPSTMTAEEMRTFREAQGWSRGELSRRLGVSPGAVTRWESGERTISEPVAQLIRYWS